MLEPSLSTGLVLEDQKPSSSGRIRACGVWTWRVRDKARLWLLACADCQLLSAVCSTRTTMMTASSEHRGANADRAESTCGANGACGRRRALPGSTTHATRQGGYKDSARYWNACIAAHSVRGERGGARATHRARRRDPDRRRRAASVLFCRAVGRWDGFADDGTTKSWSGDALHFASLPRPSSTN